MPPSQTAADFLPAETFKGDSWVATSGHEKEGPLTPERRESNPDGWHCPACSDLKAGGRYLSDSFILFVFYTIEADRATTHSKVR
jgi:hypothetical protein